MPLYLVRWTGRAASLIRAHDEDELMAILDETGDPGVCSWGIYNGPLAIDFELDLPFKKPEGADAGTAGAAETELADNIDLFLEAPMKVVRPGGDTDWEMVRQVFERAFPDLYAAWDEAWEEGEGSGTPATLDVRKAVYVELGKEMSPPTRGSRRKGPIVRRANTGSYKRP